MMHTRPSMLLEPQRDPAAAPADDLEQQVDALLREVDASDKQLTQIMADPTPAPEIDSAAIDAALKGPESASSDATDQDMGSLVDELLASVNTANAPSQSEQTASDASDVSPDDLAALEAAVDPAAEPATANEAEPAADATAPSEAPSAAADATPEQLDAISAAQPQEAVANADQSLDALDTQIAATADEELATASPAQLLGVPETPLAAALVHGGTVGTPGGHAPANKPSESTHDHAGARTHESKPSTSRDKARRVTSEFAGTLAHALEPVSAKVLALAAKPLANRPKSVKSAVALVAANTTFFATAFWGYLLFFRPTQPAAAVAEPFDFKTSGLPSPQHRDAHGEHAGAASHDAGKGGGHGDAKGGKDAGKPLIDSKPKHLLNEVEAERAKAAKAGATSGGGQEKKGGH